MGEVAVGLEVVDTVAVGTVSVVVVVGTTGDFEAMHLVPNFCSEKQIRGQWSVSGRRMWRRVDRSDNACLLPFFQSTQSSIQRIFIEAERFLCPVTEVAL